MLTASAVPSFVAQNSEVPVIIQLQHDCSGSYPDTEPCSPSEAGELLAPIKDGSRCFHPLANVMLDNPYNIMHKNWPLNIDWNQSENSEIADGQRWTN